MGTVQTVTATWVTMQDHAGAIKYSGLYNARISKILIPTTVTYITSKGPQPHQQIGGYHASGGDLMPKIHDERSNHGPIIWVKDLSRSSLVILLADQLRKDIQPHRLNIVIDAN